MKLSLSGKFSLAAGSRAVYIPLGKHSAGPSLRYRTTCKSAALPLPSGQRCPLLQAAAGDAPGWRRNQPPRAATTPKPSTWPGFEVPLRVRPLSGLKGLTPGHPRCSVAGDARHLGTLAGADQSMPGDGFGSIDAVGIILQLAGVVAAALDNLFGHAQVLRVFLDGIDSLRLVIARTAGDQKHGQETNGQCGVLHEDPSPCGVPSTVCWGRSRRSPPPSSSSALQADVVCSLTSSPA